MTAMIHGMGRTAAKHPSTVPSITLKYRQLFTCLPHWT